MAGNENEELFETLAAQAAPERIGEAVPRLRTAERRQVEWRPVSLEELAPDDHRVRAVWRFVEGLDLSALLSPIKSLEGRPGHPAADPRILLALWLFATIEGVASARQVARLCGEHIAYRWLCGGVGMNAKSLAACWPRSGAGRPSDRQFRGVGNGKRCEFGSRYARRRSCASIGGSSLVPPACDLGRLPGRSGASDTPSTRRSLARSLRGEPARGRGATAGGP
jgi:hypothetical protein